MNKAFVVVSIYSIFISICRYVTARVICAKRGILFLQILYTNALHLVQIIFVLCKELSAQYCTYIKKFKKMVIDVLHIYTSSKILIFNCYTNW